MPALVHRLTLYVSVFVGLIVAVVMGYLVSGAEGNVVRVLSMVVAVGTFAWSVVRPKTGLHLLVIMAASLDLAKRCLIIYEDFSMTDVAIVLSMAPITMAGVFFGCLLQPLLQGRRLTPTQFRLVLISCVGIGLALVLHYLNSRSLKSAVVDSANDGAYILLLPIAYSLFHDRSQRDVQRFLSFCLAVFTPVALYGCWQFFAGFNDLEVEYLQSGLTQTEANLYEARPRPFSTLNSITSFSVVMWFCLVVAFYFCFAHRWRHRLSDWLRPVIFLVGMLLSFARGAMTFGIANLLVLYIFRSSKWTRLVYGTGFALFIAMVLNAELIRVNLDVIQSYLPQSQGATGEKLWNIYTFSDRLMGYRNVLGNPSAWSLFGMDTSSGGEGYDEFYSHDALSQLILKHGILIALLLVGIVVATLRWAHGRVWALPAGRRNFAAFLLSVVVVTLISNLAGYILHIYPINLFFWLFIGLFYTVVHGAGLPEVPPEDEELACEEPESVPELAVVGERGFPHFVPSRGGTLSMPRRVS